MLQTVLVWVVLLIVAVGCADGCTCLLQHKQDLYCNADFVLQVKVKHEEIIYAKKEVFTAENQSSIERYPVSRKYTVRVRKVFKIKENNLGLSKNSTGAVMHTAIHDATCGVELQVKKKYITAGHYSNDQLSLNLCGWVEPWEWLSKMQKRHLRSMYETNCDCTVVNIHTNGHWKRSQSDICEWDAYSDDGDCYNRQSACKHNKNTVLGECKWQRNGHLKACRKEVKRRRWEP